MINEQYEKINCNICEKDDTVLLSKTGQFGLPTNVVICRNCGLSYLNPRWTKSTYLDFYTNHYDKYYRPNIKNIRVKKEEINPIYERLLKAELLTEGPKHILDVGSGSGLNLDFFKLKFPESQLYAIEPSETAVNILQKNGIEIISRDVDTDWNRPFEKKFDLIIMRHVLEHFSDPVAALQKIGSTLSDNGILYIAVPNCMNPVTPLLTNWFRVVHTYYFNIKTLKRILRKSNLSPIFFIEGDQFNQGELITYVNRSENSSTEIIDNNSFSEQLKVFTNCLQKERSLIPTVRRQVKFFNQKIKRAIQ